MEQVPRPATEGLRRLANPIVVRAALESLDGEYLLAVGGGETLEKALESALKGAPAHKQWRLVGWNPYAI